MAITVHDEEFDKDRNFLDKGKKKSKKELFQKNTLDHHTNIIESLTHEINDLKKRNDQLIELLLENGIEVPPPEEEYDSSKYKDRSPNRDKKERRKSSNDTTQSNLS